jgi:hypothetical protein
MTLEEEEPPEPVDDAGDGGHEVHERDEQRPEASRGDLGDEQGCTSGDRNRDDQGHDGDRHRVEEHGGNAEVVDVRLPRLGREEAPARHAQGLERVQKQEEPDDDHDCQDEEPTEPRRQPEDAVAQTHVGDEPPPRPLVGLQGSLGALEDGQLVGCPDHRQLGGDRLVLEVHARTSGWCRRDGSAHYVCTYRIELIFRRHEGGVYRILSHDEIQPTNGS